MSFKIMHELGNAERDCLHWLSELVLGCKDGHTNPFDHCSKLDEHEQHQLATLADLHHVSMRASLALTAFARGGSARCPAWVADLLQEQTDRIQRALEILASVCQELETVGFPVVVMKSLDHWPDLGTDLDLYTAGAEEYILRLMQERFQARIEPQSWGDRLACKWNLRLPGLPELIEIHIGRLGQTGEQTRLGRVLLDRRTEKELAGHKFHVPCAEHQIILTVLDRFYRHYHFRICDVANTAHLVVHQRVDFEQLEQECERAGLRQGLSAYLHVIDQYYAHYRGQHLPLPSRILRCAVFGVDKVYAHAGLLRIPLFPQGAHLFTGELAKALGRMDLWKSLRLSLVPPLAMAAGAKLGITGSEKGIW
jgi:Uncharacterised nucleotidyltransferase